MDNIHDISNNSPENPVSSNYPEDGTCTYCGDNDWTHIFNNVSQCNK